jgi:hypothetical protein
LNPAALSLSGIGVRVSRRTLRDAGLRGSNAEPGALVKVISGEFADNAASHLMEFPMTDLADLLSRAAADLPR